MNQSSQSSWKAETLIGMRLGSCTLERPLGVGGMGAVYLARQDRPRRQVAVKVLRPQLASDEQNWPIFLARFRREADATAGLDHTNIVPIYAFGEEQGVAYLIMPYLPDGSLADLLMKRGPLSIDRTLKYLEDAASALDYAHAHGIIHRDVKPSNLLLHPDGRLLLADFGIARPLDLTDLPPTPAGSAANGNAQLTQAGVAMGTPEFMAPEQIKGGTLSAATDIYELGIVTYAMLTNRTPFGGTDVPTTLARQLREPPIALRRLRPDTPPGLEAAVLWALAKEPAARPRTAGDFARAARAGALGQPLTLPTATPNLYAAQTPNPYATARLPMARVAPPMNAPLPVAPQIAPQPAPQSPVAPPQPLPGAVVAGAVGVAPLASAANGMATVPAAALGGAPTGRAALAPHFAPVITGGPAGANDATVYDAQQLAGYGRVGQAQPVWPGVGAPAAPARQRPTRGVGGFCLAVVSALVVFTLVLVAAFFVASALHANAGSQTGGGSPTTGLSHVATPTPTATVAPSPTATTVPTNVLSVSPVSLIFSCTTTNGLTHTVTLSNTGPTDITWHDADLTSGFHVSSSSGELAAGDSKTISIHYSPTAFKSAGKVVFTVESPDALAGQQTLVTFTVVGCPAPGAALIHAA